MTDTSTRPSPRYAMHGIPNNRAGRAFVAAVRRYLNHERYKIVTRANGPRVATAAADGVSAEQYRQGLPLRHAKSLRLYLNDAPARLAEQRAERRLSEEWHLNRYDALLTERNLWKQRHENMLASYSQAERERNNLSERLQRMPRLALWIERMRNWWRKPR